MLTRRPTIALVNGRISANGTLAASLRFNSRILAIDERPKPSDVVVDLDGAFVLPGLVNAHDHLELNHYGPLKRRHRYENVSGWIDDLRPALRADPHIRRGSSHPLAERLLIGALKNLLAGVTTVAHHNPRYREIGRGFPIRVVKRYGWAHSFGLADQPVGAQGEIGGDVAVRWRRTPSDAPFIVHLAEGVDEVARLELPRLEALGCLQSNTVLVHGVALSEADCRRVVEAGASLVWCPASNAFLFGRTAPVRSMLDVGPASARHVCLATDSRVTGARDLLEEMREAATLTSIAAQDLLKMVTEGPARILRLPEAGRIAEGVPADLVVVPPRGCDAAHTLLATERRHVSLVTVGGHPIVGAPALKAVFVARQAAPQEIVVDGVERLMEGRLARAVARCPIREPGVDSVAT
jgi:cytosine/adenosine deaminase-related metal-dependent hydrolase